MTAHSPCRPDSKNPILLIIVTGLSGSGKSTALAVFEDMGFLTIDGLPAALAPGMIRMMRADGLRHYAGIALGMDIRQTEFSWELDQALNEMHMHDLVEPHVIFFEADSGVLLKRYAATRRPHPLEKEGIGLEKALDLERHRLRRLRKRADLVVDTSTFSIHDLRRAIQNKWEVICQSGKSLRVHVIAFGFKYGTPSEADMVFDLRFLPNPYFIPELKPLSGLDAAISDYVLKNPPGDEYLERLSDFLLWTLARFSAEGRFRLTIAIGCTGGRHRSVAVADALTAVLRAHGYAPTLEHRHLNLG